MLYKKGFTTFYTTADIGLHIVGKNKKELIVNSFKGISYLIGTPKIKVNNRELKKESIKIKKESFESLIVNFLNEVIFIHEKTVSLPYKFKVIELKNNSLLGSIYLLPKNLSNFRYELKAVTYHNLKIVKKRKYYHIKILIDI